MEIAENKKTIRQQAMEEIADEKIEEAKESLKEKYRELSAAKVIVRNYLREIEDIELELEQELEDARL